MSDLCPFCFVPKDECACDLPDCFSYLVARSSDVEYFLERNGLSRTEDHSDTRSDIHE